MTWAAGFVFVGLAIESESAEASILSLATGIVLPVLAALSARLAPELLLVAAALIAAWIATAILRR
jgi:predicted branched-subunit amino acid permease